MKQCPFCKASIEEDARFCVYCMSSLDQKKEFFTTKRRRARPIIILSAIAAVCFAIAVLAATHTANGNRKASITPVPSVTEASERVTVSKAPAVTASTTGTASTTAVTDSSNGVSYLYRPTESGDEFDAVGTPRPANGITIIDVETPAEDGIYDIPAYIDGQPVLAVAEYAFCRPDVAPTVKTVYFPATITTVNEFAFSSCRNLSDVYYRGDIHVRGYAYPDKTHREGPLTVHCAEDCHNRNSLLHKHLVNEADNTYYEVWNGEA